MLEKGSMLHDECRDETDGLGADRHDENMKQLSNHLCQTFWKPLKTIQNHTPSRQSADTAAAFTTGGVANLDTMTG